MDTTQSTIRAFNKVLSNHAHTFQKELTTRTIGFPEEFAIKRFLGKFEEPSPERVQALESQCWETWIAADQSIKGIHLPSGEWYRVRSTLHGIVTSCKFETVDFPKGSEYTPTRGQNSVEARLISTEWSCTYDNFEQFARICYRHKALKRAVKRKYNTWFRGRNFDVPRGVSDGILYRNFAGKSRRNADVAYDIFSWKLAQVTKLVHGSRFSTVPKNNLKRRPINLEAFGNILSQRSIGLHLKQNVLQRRLDVDLDGLALRHRYRIRDNDVATIDLQNASDSIALSLVEFLFPASFVKQIKATRSPFIYGLDKVFHPVRKVSSMGCGFTFELMTLILTCLCRTLDPNSSVFGDDIIIAKDKAPRLIQLLQEVGFVVNEEKSFIDGPFRESCGANYHDNFGYLESYDFKWCESINDCIVVYNKVCRLSKFSSLFGKLRKDLHRCIPLALRGSYRRDVMDVDYIHTIGNHIATTGLLNHPFSGSFHSNEKPFCNKGRKDDQLKRHDQKPARNPKKQRIRKQLDEHQMVTPTKRQLDILQKVASSLNYDMSHLSLFIGFEYVPALRSRTVITLENQNHWAKYEMYLHGGMVSKDVLTGEGQWVKVLMCTFGGLTFRFSSLKRAHAA